MTTPIQTLYDYLDNAGLFATWTDPDSITQDAPVVQMRYLDENAIDNDERVLLIKQVSQGGGDRFVSMPTYVFAVLGKVGESPIYAETYANLIYNALLDFTFSDCVVGIEPLGAVNGAYKMESGRVVYDTEWIVDVDNGVFGG